MTPGTTLYTKGFDPKTTTALHCPGLGYSDRPKDLIPGSGNFVRRTKITSAMAPFAFPGCLPYVGKVLLTHRASIMLFD